MAIIELNGGKNKSILSSNDRGDRFQKWPANNDVFTAIEGDDGIRFWRWETERVIKNDAGNSSVLRAAVHPTNEGLMLDFVMPANGIAVDVRYPHAPDATMHFFVNPPDYAAYAVTPELDGDKSWCSAARITPMTAMGMEVMHVGEGSPRELPVFRTINDVVVRENIAIGLSYIAGSHVITFGFPRVLLGADTGLDRTLTLPALHSRGSIAERVKYVERAMNKVMEITLQGKTIDHIDPVNLLGIGNNVFLVGIGS